MKIVADDKIPFLKGVFEPFAEVVYLPGDQISAAALINADALLTRSITKCNQELLKNTTVQFIASATIGNDHIDTPYCEANNIQWLSAKGCNSTAVEQYVITALLHLSVSNNFLLKNNTIGIIGVGNIGSRVAKAAELLGMNVLLNDPPRAIVEGSDKFASIDYVCKHADIITIHVPLIKVGRDKTFHLANDDFFNNLKNEVLLINSSRGDVVNTLALKRAIKSAKVKHTALDVWENEPTIDQELLNLVDIATPHIAGYSMNGKARGTEMVVNAIIDFFNLNMDYWKPEIPVSCSSFALDCSDLSDLEVLRQVFNQVYPIMNDDTELRNNSNNFEQLRRNYLYRKEKDAFKLDLNGVSESLKQLLMELGFKFLN